MNRAAVDIVYALGKGSKHNDLELRYSLRSVEAHVQGYRNVIVVGEKPEWLTGVVHIAAEDNWQKEANIMRKILEACYHAGTSEEFLFCNDDHFFIDTVTAGRYPYYHKGDLLATIDGRRQRGLVEGYYLSLQNTMRALHDAHKPALNFDIHTPIVYSKAWFPDVVRRYYWDLEGSLVVKSIYCNTLHIGGERLDECRLNRQYTEAEIDRRIAGRNVFSIGDDGLTADMRYKLQKLFPKKSRYEH